MYFLDLLAIDTTVLLLHCDFAWILFHLLSHSHKAISTYFPASHFPFFLPFLDVRSVLFFIFQIFYISHIYSYSPSFYFPFKACACHAQPLLFTFFILTFSILPSSSISFLLTLVCVSSRFSHIVRQKWLLFSTKKTYLQSHTSAATSSRVPQWGGERLSLWPSQAACHVSWMLTRCIICRSASKQSMLDQGCWGNVVKHSNQVKAVSEHPNHPSNHKSQFQARPTSTQLGRTRLT